MKIRLFKIFLALIFLGMPKGLLLSEIKPNPPPGLVSTVVSNYARSTALTHQEVINQFAFFHDLTRKLAPYNLVNAQLSDDEKIAVSSLYDDGGKYFRQVNKFAEAISSFSNAIKIHDRNLSAYRDLARTCLRWGMDLVKQNKDGREKYQQAYDVYQMIYTKTKKEEFKTLSENLKKAYLSN